MGLDSYSRLMDEMSPEQLKIIASGQTGDTIAQFAAVKALRDRTQMANAMNTQQPPQQTTVLENVVNQAKMAGIPKVGPNQTSQAIPQGIAAIARQQGNGLQDGGPVREPLTDALLGLLQGRTPGQSRQAQAPSERETASERGFTITGNPDVPEAGPLFARGGISPSPGVQAPQAAPAVPVDPSSPTTSVVGQIAGTDGAGPRGPVSFSFNAPERPIDIQIPDPREEQPQQSSDEMLTSIFGEAPRVGGGGRSNVSIDVGEEPTMEGSLEQIRALFPSGDKNRARSQDRLNDLEKEAMQENRFQRNMGLALMGLGLADRGRWSDAQAGLQMISRANSDNAEVRRGLAQMANQIDAGAVEEARQTFDVAMQAFNAARTDQRAQQQLQVQMDQFDRTMDLQNARLHAELDGPRREIAMSARMLYAASQGTDEPLTEQEALQTAITLALSSGRSSSANAPDVTDDLGNLAADINEMVSNGISTPAARRAVNDMITLYNDYVGIARAQGQNFNTRELIPEPPPRRR